MASTPQGAPHRFAAAALCCLLAFAPLSWGQSPREIVGSMQGPVDTLFPGSSTGSYGFVRHTDGAITYFRVNGRNTRASHIDPAGRVVGRFEGSDGVTREFVVRVPRTGGYVEVTLEGDTEDLVG